MTLLTRREQACCGVLPLSQYPGSTICLLQLQDLSKSTALALYDSCAGHCESSHIVSPVPWRGAPHIARRDADFCHINEACDMQRLHSRPFGRTSTILRPAGSSSRTRLLPRFLMSRNMPVLSAKTKHCWVLEMHTSTMLTRRCYRCRLQIQHSKSGACRGCKQRQRACSPGFVKIRNSVCGWHS